MYIMYQLQFVDCLQPQVVILSSLYYSKLNAFSHILTTTTIKNITKYLWFQYEQLLRAAFSHMIRTTTTTESIIKYTAYPSKTLLYQYEQSLRDTYAPEPSPKCIYTPVPLSKDKIYIETSCGLLIVILFIEISRGLLDVRLDAFSNIFTTTTTTTTKSTTLSSPYYVQLDVSSNIFKTTTKTKSTTKNPLFQYKKRCNVLNAYSQQLQTTLIPNTRGLLLGILFIATYAATVTLIPNTRGLSLGILFNAAYAATFGKSLSHSNNIKLTEKLNGLLLDILFFATFIPNTCGLSLGILFIATYAATFTSIPNTRGLSLGILFITAYAATFGKVLSHSNNIKLIEKLNQSSSKLAQKSTNKILSSPYYIQLDVFSKIFTTTTTKTKSTTLSSPYNIQLDVSSKIFTATTTTKSTTLSSLKTHIHSITPHKTQIPNQSLTINL